MLCVHLPPYCTTAQADIEQREQRVGELEALLGEVSVARDGLRQSVHDYEATLQQLEAELRDTREHQLAAQQEVSLYCHSSAYFLFPYSHSRVSIPVSTFQGFHYLSFHSCISIPVFSFRCFHSCSYNPVSIPVFPFPELSFLYFHSCVPTPVLPPIYIPVSLFLCFCSRTFIPVLPFLCSHSSTSNS